MTSSVTVHTTFGAPEVRTIDNVHDIIVEPGGFLSLKHVNGTSAGLFAPGSWRAVIPIVPPEQQEEG